MGAVELRDVICQQSLEIPDAELEYQRFESMQKLRDCHRALIENKLSLSVPKMSFNRWHMERKVLEAKYFDKPYDPIIPSLHSAMDPYSPSLFQEIIEDIPLKVNMFPKDIQGAKKSLSLYLEACESLSINDKLDDPLSEDQLEKITTEIKSYKNWLEKVDYHSSANEIIQKLVDAKKAIGTILQDKMKNVVAEVCSNLAKYSDRLFHDIQKQKKVMTIEKMGLFTENVIFDKKRNVVHLSIRNLNTLGLSSHFSLNEDCYQKLQNFFRKRIRSIKCEDFDKEIIINYMIFCLVIRYQALFGETAKPFEGAGLQGALPESVFEILHNKLGVQMECFASPLNAYFPEYCSAFQDIDFWFGSVGNFFNFYPTSGSFEANPPFIEELMIKMVEHMEYLLKMSNEPLSFTVIVPNWSDATSFVSMQKSEYLRAELLLEPKKHCYRNGFQHKVKKENLIYNAIHATHIFFLQNESGYKKWTPTTDVLKEIKDAFKVNLKKF